MRIDARYKGYAMRWIYPAVGKPFVAIHEIDFDYEYVCEAESIAAAKRLINAFLKAEASAAAPAENLS